MRHERAPRAKGGKSRRGRVRYHGVGQSCVVGLSVVSGGDNAAYTRELALPAPSFNLCLSSLSWSAGMRTLLHLVALEVQPQLKTSAFVV